MTRVPQPASTDLAARRVWPSVKLALDPASLPAGDGPVLLLGTNRTYVSALSLARMRDRIEAGTDAVIPYAVATTDLARTRRLYTLRQFEELEIEFFGGATARYLL